MTTDHAALPQSASAPAPTPDDKLRNVAQSLFSEPEGGDPNAWTEQESPAEPEATETPPENLLPEEPAAVEATPPEDMEEIEYGEGKKYSVPKELKRGWLREDDYTRKTQKLADGFRSVDAQLERLTQTAQSLTAVAPMIGRVHAIDAEIQGIEQQLADPRLAQEDPLAIGTLSAKLHLLERQRGQLASALQGEEAKFVQAVEQARQQTVRARMEAEMPFLESTIREFNPEKHGQELVSYIKKAGLAQEALGFINTSPAALALVWKAKQYDQLQADKKVAQKKVETLPPVAKPGQRAPQAEGGDLKKLETAMRKDGGKTQDLRLARLSAMLNGKK